MIVNFDKVSKIIIKEGNVTIDGVEYTEDINCREIEGLHDLVVNGKVQFRQMKPADFEFVRHEKLARQKVEIEEVKDSEILNLQAEVVELEYQKALEVME